MISKLKDIFIVFNHQDGISLFKESLDHLQKLFNVCWVESYCWLIKEVYGISSIFFEEVFYKFEPLGFSSRKGMCRLSHFEITESDFYHQLEFLFDMIHF